MVCDTFSKLHPGLTISTQDLLHGRLIEVWRRRAGKAQPSLAVLATVVLRFAAAPTFLDDMATAPTVLDLFLDVLAALQAWIDLLAVFSGVGLFAAVPALASILVRPFGVSSSALSIIWRRALFHEGFVFLLKGMRLKLLNLLEDFSVDLIWRKKTGPIGYTADNIDKKHPRNYPHQIKIFHPPS